MKSEAIAKALGGRRAGGMWMARCPAHEDTRPSLAISSAANGKVLVHCHAGCKQADVVAALRAAGLWDTSLRSGGLRRPPESGGAPGGESADNVQRTQAAMSVWCKTLASDGTLVETYLQARSLITSVPPKLRFHPSLKHPAGQFWPCMVALVSRGWDDTPVAIHRTFLARDGLGKAPVVPAKMMLGPCRGGAVRLGEPGDVLMIGEGIETCLAAAQATGLAAWASLSTSGMRSLDLPEALRNVVVLADGDEAGEAAALDCAQRWTREGRNVRIARPPAGMDFNDVLMRTGKHERGTQA